MKKYRNCIQRFEAFSTCLRNEKKQTLPYIPGMLWICSVRGPQKRVLIAIVVGLPWQYIHVLLIKLANSMFLLLKFPILVGHIQGSRGSIQTSPGKLRSKSQLLPGIDTITFPINSHFMVNLFLSPPSFSSSIAGDGDSGIISPIGGWCLIGTFANPCWLPG